MVIRSKHNPVIYPFFKLYTLWKIRRNFHKVVISGEFREKDKAVLLISNHFSWWDGFWAMYLNMKVFKRKFHFMMLEDQLEKFWFFKHTGGYPVRKKTRSIIDTINYTVKILASRKNIVLLFPQGKIESLYNNSIVFEKGIARIVRETSGKAQTLFVVNLIDYFSETKPALYVYFKELNMESNHNEDIKGAYDRFYAACVSEQIKKAAEG